MATPRRGRNPAADASLVAFLTLVALVALE
jgi:hypothetical protein